MDSDQKPKKKMGRPLTVINWKAFEVLCNVQCTEIEIAAQLGISVDTLYRAVKREKKMTFAEYFSTRGAPIGRVTLRSMLWDKAKKGDIIAIKLLATQYLGFSDKVQLQHEGMLNSPVIVVLPAKGSHTLEEKSPAEKNQNSAELPAPGVPSHVEH